MRRGSSVVALLAVPDGESADTAENCLTYGLLWLNRARQMGRRENVAALRLIVPKSTSRTIAHRMAALDSRLPVELYERDRSRETVEKIDPRLAGNLDSWLVPHRDTEVLLRQVKSAVGSIVAMAPKAITLHPVPHACEVWLQFRGLPFARWHENRIDFGAGDAQEELTDESRPALKRLLQELETHRHPLVSDTRHTLYRAQPERWLESLVREDVTRVDGMLDPRFVYAQVFANAGGEHGILDLLAMTRAGRLAIIELKASEHIHLPLQAAGYWLHVRRQLQNGEISRYGYFPKIELQQALPLVYLVAPALRFHPATDDLLRYLSPDLEVVRVGLAESWRRGLRVVMRQ
jgi:hypothetical protein